MLFRNLKSGNVVSATDAGTIELMRESEFYEPAEIPPAEPKRPARGKRGMSNDAGT